MADAMDMTVIRERLQFHMKRRGVTARKLSLDAGLNDTAVRDLLNKRIDDPRFGTLLKLANALKVSPATLFGGVVEIGGNINEHGEIEPFLADNDARETAPLPPEVVGDAQAFYIDSNVLMPAFWAGDVIFVSGEHDAEPSEFVGRECVVQIAATGARLLRTVEEETAPGRFTLGFHKPGQELLNVQLAWAAPVLFVMRKGQNRQSA